MKTKMLLSVIIGSLSFIGASAQTYYYNTTKTFYENGYAYQCDVPEWKMVTLYNKINVYTYVDMYNKDTKVAYLYNGKNDTLEEDTWTKSKCFSIVNNAFSAVEKQRVKGKKLGITFIISPQTGKIMEVNYDFLRDDPCATIPVSVYRNMELKFKNEVWFTPTAEGKKMNYILHYWMHDIE